MSAPRPHRAVLALVILALAFSLACIPNIGGNRDKTTSGTGPSGQPAAAAVPTPTPYAGGSRTVKVLWFRQTGPSSAEGGVSQFRVTVAPKTDPGIRVSFSESEVSGQGSQMRAAGWTAAVMSSLLLGIDPSRLAFTYDVSGRIDGPSAGALMTIATLAAILGDEIPADFAMTGTINPDGSIGPVGGIPQKIDGAAKAGVKTVLVPAGQRTDRDAASRQGVDLIRRGDEQGVKVTLVPNIYEAYQAATGKPLPQPRGTAARVEMPSRTYDRMRAQTNTWLARYTDARNRANAFSAPVRNFYASELAVADDYAAKARRSLQEGAVEVALERATTAALWATIVNTGGGIYQTWLDRNVQAAIAQAQATTAARAANNALLDRLSSENPSTASDALALMEAWSNATLAESLLKRGDSEVQSLIQRQRSLREGEFVDELVEAVRSYALAEIVNEIARVSLDIYSGSGTARAPGLDSLAGIAEMLRRATEANMAAIDATVISPIAEDAGVRDEVVRNFLIANDFYYQVAYLTNRDLGITADRTGQPRSAQVYATLGGALNAFTLSTAVLAKYYSLDAQVDGNFNVVSFGRETALQNMVQLAERRAEELVSLPKEVPLPAVYYLANAKVLRDGTAEDKVGALVYYWQAAILSQALANMTGEFGEKIQGDLRSQNRPAEFHAANTFRAP